VKISLNWISDYIDINGADLSFLFSELNKSAAKIKKVTEDNGDIIIHFNDNDILDNPELWSHYGIAREISKITGRDLLDIEYVNEGYLKYMSSSVLNLQEEEVKSCLRCSAIKVENISEEVSPAFISNRLTSCGIAAHSLAIDLANYVMMDIGQQLYVYKDSLGSLIVEAAIFDGDNKNTSMTAVAICRYIRLLQEYMPEARAASALYDNIANTARNIDIQFQNKYISF
jgi:hypothetical protein